MSKNKKLLFVNSSLSGGGSERVMCLLANEFSKRNYHVDMALLREGEDKYYVDKRIKLIRFKYKYNNKVYKIIKRINKLHVILKNDYDYIISFMSDINICTIISNIGINKKIIVSERADPSQKTRKCFQRFLEKRLYQYAYNIVLQTNYVRQFFNKKLQNKIVVIPNPINPNLPERDINEINNTIVAVGRLTDQKNFSLLIDGFSKMNVINDKFNLIIYGEGKLRDNLVRQIDSLNLSKKVFLPGYIKNINQEMKNASIYVSTSKFEGISNALLEAMAMGIPSIATDCPVGGAKMLIDTKKNGILIPVDDQDALVNALLELTSDEELYNNISEEAKKIKKLYSMKKIADRWETLFR